MYLLYFAVIHNEGVAFATRAAEDRGSVEREVKSLSKDAVGVRYEADLRMRLE